MIIRSRESQVWFVKALGGFTRLIFLPSIRPLSVRLMYLLYLDESGDPENVPGDEYFVLGGIAVFERQAHWLSQQVDSIETTCLPIGTSSPVEFHASEIARGASSPWNQLNPREREALLYSLCAVITDSDEANVLFATAIHRPSNPEKDLIARAFEDITSRFDLFLKRLHAKGNSQRGLLILDRNRQEKRLQTLLDTYRKEGSRFGRLVNFADVPFFTDSKSSRLVQLADLVAWATFRRYERGDSRFFDRLVGRFDSEDGKIHGLLHLTLDRADCFCTACISRRSP